MKRDYTNIVKAGRDKTFFGGLMITIVLVLSSLLNSCESFLKEEPLIMYSADQYYDSPKKLNMAVLGIYDMLSQQSLFGANLVLLAGDTDVEMLRNTTGGTGLNIEDIGHFNADAGASTLETIWSSFYTAINRANVAIANAGLVPATSNEDQRTVKKFVAESKALRALCYQYLVVCFGDIPLRIIPADMSQNLFVPRTPKADVYAQIIKDYEEAIVDLPWYNADPELKGRMNKGAAMALLARACLFAGGYSLYQDGKVKRPDSYMTYYQKAAQVTKALIDSGKHALNPSFEQIFRTINGNLTDQSESMFEIDLAYLYGQSRHAGQIGSNATGILVSGYSALYDCRSKIFTHYYTWLKFAANDLRRGISIADFSLTGGPAPLWAKVPILAKSSQTWMFAKWRRDWSGSVPTNWSLTDCNFVVIRYGEVLLMRAEILNEINNGPTPEAIDLVNQVRRRGYGLPILTTSAVSDIPASAKVSKDTFFNFLTDEYVRETLGEHHRKYHLIRWNLLGAKLADVNSWFAMPANYNVYHSVKTQNYLGYTLFHPGKDELLPIPKREVVENKGAVVQNPGF